MSRIAEQLSPEFSGDTYSPRFDHRRLSGQLKRVYAVMSDGRWRSLAELAMQADGSEAGVSARLRDLRKRSFGSHVIDRRRVGTSGLFQYRMVK